MRLVHVPTLQLQEFYGDLPRYAIASHRWLHEEITLQQMSNDAEIYKKAGYEKIFHFCKAITKLTSTLCPQLNLEYLWIDTCCIDKTNSVELQEALNSMFRWYAEAEVCITYLHDVCSLDEHPSTLADSLRASGWFKRGWTLQELIAPKRILFYNKDWEIVGRKMTAPTTPWITARVAGLSPLNNLLTEITGVPANVLWDFTKHIEKYSVDDRRSWMNGRSTTRKEDKVYCQLGIFGVFMPLIYGEGDHAMIRLEEAIEQKEQRFAARAATGPVGKKPPELRATTNVPAWPSIVSQNRTFTIHYMTHASQYAKMLCIDIAEHKTVKDLFEDVIPRLRKIDSRYKGGYWRLRTDWRGFGETLELDRVLSTIEQNGLYIIANAWLFPER